MTAENRKPIGSITEAMLIAKRANGIIPIAPCVKTLQCPKQRGVLTLIDTSALGENGSKGTSQKSRV